ncbi:hypothetical protein D3C76_1426130 [compost metagenome]
MALIKPTVPIEIKSSTSLFCIEYFFTICATNLKFLSISILFAETSPSWNFFKYNSSSASESGFGNVLLLLFIYPVNKGKLHIISIRLLIINTDVPPNNAY